MVSEGARTAESRLNIYLISKGQSGIITAQELQVISFPADGLQREGAGGAVCIDRPIRFGV